MTKYNSYMPGDILSHTDIVGFEKFNVQQGMNFRSGKNGVSIFLMSTKNNAPYNDELRDNGRIIIYEGHDISRKYVQDNPKLYNQPLKLPSGKLTTNGKFYESLKNNIKEYVRVYEKMQPGIWVYNGTFIITDFTFVQSEGRRVIRFTLEITNDNTIGSQNNLNTEHNRVIPSHVKQIVYKRDGGKCVLCQSTVNLHYDHELPYSKGGVSFLPENIRLLCASCNLKKSDKIE